MTFRRVRPVGTTRSIAICRNGGAQQLGILKEYEKREGYLLWQRVVSM